MNNVIFPVVQGIIILNFLTVRKIAFTGLLWSKKIAVVLQIGFQTRLVSPAKQEQFLSSAISHNYFALEI